jgi:hypothetical protein
MTLPRLFLILLLACSGLAGAVAQTFKPFTALRVIQTERFDIIFPSESERTARSLAAKADGIYDRVSGLLGISLEQRIPVSITPHTDLFNGYMFPVPYPHVVLYDTPMDIGMTTYENSLEGLFLHELTHAISLNTRHSGLKAWHRIFGGWVMPSVLTAPSFMVEGVTVSFESLDGFGRANDPLVKQQLLQDMHEGAFLTPFQAAGAAEYPNNRAAFYEYGGLFSAWLQQSYGMEQYARLWQAMGRDFHFSLFFYNYGFFNIFRNIYGMDFPDAWTMFREHLWTELLSGRTIEENPLEPAYRGAIPGSSFVPRQGAVIPAVAASGLAGDGRVFFLDTIAQAALSYDGASGKVRRIAPADTSAYSLDVSADGDRLLISSYRQYTTGSLYTALSRAVVTEYTAKGRKTGRVYRSLYQGRYFRDGVIGLSSDLHNNNLVFRRGNEEQLLLRGAEDLLYGDPSAINDDWIAFVAAKKGIRELCLYNFQTRQVYTLGSGLADDQDDRSRWRYVRSAQVSQGRLLFAYNQGRGMYKLGAVDISGFSGAALPEALEAVFAERDFSGGVSRPVAAGGAIFYRGAFSQFDALLRYPESPGVLSGDRVPLALKPWSAEDRARALPKDAAYDAPNDNAPDSQSGFPPAALSAKRYAGISYMNPFKFWLPLPLIRLTENSVTVDGGGILSLMIDPTDTNIVMLNLYFDARFLMAAGNIQWMNYALGFPLQFVLSDDLDRTVDPDVRITQASLDGTLSIALGNGRARFDIIPGLNAAFVSEDPGDNSGAYTWGYDEQYYSASLGLGVSSMVRPSWALFGRGLSLYGYARFLLNQDEPFSFPPVPRLEGVFSAAMEPWLPLRVQIYGAWDEQGMDLHGRSGYYLDAAFSSAVPVEYSRQSHIPLEWLAGAEAELKLFSLDIQKSLSHLYYNRIYSALAWRGALYDDQGIRDAKGNSAEGTFLAASPQGSYRLAQSLMLRLGLVVTTVLVPTMPIVITPYGWGAWKFPNIYDNNGNNDFSFGIGISASL